MLKIKNGYKINNILIKSFEDKFDITLPKSYKEFMVNNNRWRTRRWVFVWFLWQSYWKK